MIETPLVLRATLTSHVMRRALFKGFAIAFGGILLLVLADVFIPLPEMKLWGGSLFLISLALVTLGLLPYRRLSRLQMRPDELTLVDLDHLTYSSKGKKIVTLPLQSVERMRWIKDPINYGIAVWLKPPPIAPLVVHQLPTEVEKLRRQGFLNGQADLFFPYFNERAFNELLKWQKEEEEEEEEEEKERV